MHYSVLSVFIPLLLSAQPSQRTALDRCSIEGQVVNSVSGAPLKKATVLATRDDGPGKVGSANYSAITDSAGRFVLVKIEPGRYRVRASRNGFLGREGEAEAITLNPSRPVKALTIRLVPQAAISGRVVDEDGEPVPYVTVALNSLRGEAGQRQMVPAGSATTNDLGEYRIFGLTAGKYFLVATPRSIATGATNRSATPQPDEDYSATWYPGTRDPAAGTAVDVPAGGNVVGINIKLIKTRTYRVAGHVTPAMPAGKALVFGVMLTPRTGNGWPADPAMRTAPVDPKGNFELRGVAPGSYVLRVDLVVDGKQSGLRVPIEVSGDVDNLSLSMAGKKGNEEPLAAGAIAH